MDRVQVHPTGFIDPKNPSHPSKILAPEALRGSGGVLINDKGRRFANELGSRGYLTARIQNQCTPHAVPLESGISQPVAFMVMDQK
ncbi:osm1, partial [Symbiodinium microadriaticum]